MNSENTLLYMTILYDQLLFVYVGLSEPRYYLCLPESRY